MKLAHKTKANRYIVESAERVQNSGITVDWDSSFSTVSIECDGEDSIFMQGDNADQFIAEIEALCRRFPSLDEYTAALAIAESYAECIWG